jgi:hypothetical protein
MNRTDTELKQIFLQLKERILDLPYTESRNKFVEHIDYALDKEKEGENFVDVLLEFQIDGPAEYKNVV